MVSNSTNINEASNHLSSSITEHPTDHDIGNPGFGLEQTQQCSRLNVYILYTAHFMQYKKKLVK
jgi:hypothetical protein